MGRISSGGGGMGMLPLHNEQGSKPTTSQTGHVPQTASGNDQGSYRPESIATASTAAHLQNRNKPLNPFPRQVQRQQQQQQQRAGRTTSNPNPNPNPASDADPDPGTVQFGVPESDSEKMKKLQDDKDNKDLIENARQAAKAHQIIQNLSINVVST